MSLSSRDALALVNGTSFLSGYAALAVARAERLIGRAEAPTGWIFALLGCGEECLDPRLHAAKGHPGPRTSAAAILEASRRIGPIRGESRPLQEIYSIRCTPQILGACRDQVAYARRIIEHEMNGVSDKPLIFDGGGPVVLHGGNFHGQHAGFAADAVNATLTQVAVLADRQVDALLNPRINGGAPLFLAARPGPSSGLAGAQLACTALVAEMRLRAQAIATFSIPTNGGNQDIVSMANPAAKTAYAQTGTLASVLAILRMSLSQLASLRREGIAPGPTRGVEASLHRLRPPHPGDLEPPPALRPAVGPGVRERISIRVITEDALTIQAAGFEKRGIAIERRMAPDLPKLSLDRTRMIQVFGNLLKNSCEAFDASGPTANRLIIVEARPALDGTSVCLQLRDDARGFEPDRAGSLFEKHTSTKTRGSGIGLYHCRKVGEGHGGTLVLRSDGPGLGASSLLTLPVSRTPEADRADRPEHPSPGH